MPEPEEGWPLEDLEAALFQAAAIGRIMPFAKFSEGTPGHATGSAEVWM